MLFFFGFYATLVAFGLYAWVINLVKFVDMLGGEVTALFIGRLFGIIFPPISAVLAFV